MKYIINVKMISYFTRIIFSILKKRKYGTISYSVHRFNRWFLRFREFSSNSKFRFFLSAWIGYFSSFSFPFCFSIIFIFKSFIFMRKKLLALYFFLIKWKNNNLNETVLIQYSCTIPFLFDSSNTIRAYPPIYKHCYNN